MSSVRRLAPLALLLPGAAFAQVPDLLNAFDAGSPSLGAGGAFQASAADTFSAYFNPAGLGYLSRPQLGAAYRNFPTTLSRVTGTLGNLQQRSFPRRGSSTISHLGYAIPFRDVFRRGAGTLAVTYQVGGYVDDFSAAPQNSLINIGGGLGVANFTERRLAESEFYTVAYGRTNASQNLSFGFGVQLVQQRLELTQGGVVVDGNGNPQPGSLSPLVQRSGSSTGLGLVAGIQFQPTSIPGVSFAFSIRTPISLSGGEAASLYSRIPGRIIGGAAFRTKGLRGNDADFGVFGVQFTQFFSAGRSAIFDVGNQTGVGIGYEYLLANGRTRIPIRIGYTSLSASGIGFDRRRGLTYGIGYRPSDRLSFDVNFMRPDGGPTETIFAASYRF